MQNDRPISYPSKTLNDHEIKYATVEKVLALVWEVAYYRPNLYGKEFHHSTDNQPLVWLYHKHKGTDIYPRLQRWLLDL